MQINQTYLTHGMANKKRIYQRPQLLNIETQLQLFPNGNAERPIPKEQVRQTLNEFAYKIESNRAIMFRYAYSQTKNRDEAEDLVQDTILRTLQNERSVKGNLTGFLLNTMKWLFLNNCRAKKSNRVSYTEKLPDKAAEHNRIDDNIAYEDMELAINKLPEYLIEISQMKFLLGMKDKDIALAVLMPVGTVKSRLYVARKFVKLALKEYER